MTATLHPASNSHYTWLGHGYEVLDELMQSLFLFDNFDEIVGEQAPLAPSLARPGAI